MTRGKMKLILSMRSFMLISESVIMAIEVEVHGPLVCDEAINDLAIRRLPAKLLVYT